MKTGDIIMVRDRSFLGRLISFFTKSEYVHCAIVVDACQGYAILGEINWSYKFSLRFMDYKDYDVYRCVIPVDCLDVKLATKSLVGKRYDFRDIIGILLNLNTRETPNNVICSESIKMIYNNMGIELTDVAIPTPKDIADSKMLYKAEEE